MKWEKGEDMGSKITKSPLVELLGVFIVNFSKLRNTSTLL